MSTQSHEPIAIIGMACRLPGAPDLDALWQLLVEQRESVGLVPETRWDVDRYHHADRSHPGTMTSRRGGFLDQIDGFDAAAFGISPREAAHMDPQQRLLLELAFEAVEHAGVPVSSLRESRTGVYMGALWSDYARRYEDVRQITQHSATGQETSILSARISYTFGLIGPSMTVHTACSASLVAVHLACQSLRAGESTMAIAGGVNLLVGPESNIIMSRFGGLCADGRCKTFDATANGYARSEGAGLIVLKPLSRALEDGDHIMALVRGSAVNNDGASAGLKAPCVRAQARALEDACRDAGIAPADVDYVEAHGTGTALGDPTEATSLGTVLGQAPWRRHPLLLGSIKTNIGHLESAAGIAGLIKTVLAMRRGQIPASLHFDQPNPAIDFDTLGLEVVGQPRLWPSRDRAPLAGVNSFGFGGTNCHVILEGPPSRPRSAPRRADGATAFVALSAFDEAALRQRADQLAGHLEATHPDSLTDLAATLALERDHLRRRAVCLADSPAHLVESLRALAAGQSHPDLVTGTPSTPHEDGVVLVFPGQGGQWPGMGRELLTRDPVYRASIEDCARAFAALGVDWSLLDLIDAQAEPTRVDIIQPMIFATQVALAAALQARGVRIGAVVGHSMGEVAAACVAGALSLSDAARVICMRSRIVAEHSLPGGMAVVGLSAAEAAARLAPWQGRLEIAAINGPATVLVSGDTDALEALLAVLDGDGIFCRRVAVDYASHCHHVDALTRPLTEALAGLTPRPSHIAVYSTVEVARLERAAMDADYWRRNLRQPVRFAPTIERLLDEGHTHFVEISPHPVISWPLQEIISAHEQRAHVVATMRRDLDGPAALLRTLAAVHVVGGAIDYRANHRRPARRARLPVYPWQRQRHWLEAPADDRPRAVEPAAAPVDDGLPGRALSSPALGSARIFERVFDPEHLGIFTDHRVQDRAVVPAAALLEWARRAALRVAEPGRLAVTELVVESPLDIDATMGARRVQCVLEPQGRGHWQVGFFSTPADRDDGHWQQHARATIAISRAARDELSVVHESPEAIAARCMPALEPGATYDAFAERGLLYLGAFRRIEATWCGAGESLARLAPVSAADACPEHGVSVSLLDAALQACLPCFDADDTRVALPLSVGSYQAFGAAATGRPLWSHVRTRSLGDDGGVFDVTVIDVQGHVVARFDGVHMRLVAPSVASRQRYELRWVQATLPVAPSNAPRGTVVVFADRGRSGLELADNLRRIGGSVVVVRRLPAATDDGADHRVDPLDGDAIAHILRSAAASSVHGLRAVYFAWGLDVAAGMPSPDVAAHEQRTLIGSAMHVLRGLLEVQRTRRFRLVLTTRGAVATDEDDTSLVAPLGAMLWGWGRTAAVEHPELDVRLVDVHPSGSAPAVASVLQRALYAESIQLAWRHGATLSPRLVTATTTIGEVTLSDRIDEESTWLITGGTSGIGLATAAWLVDQGVRHLVLLSRSGTVRRPEVVSRMRAAGAEVRIVAAPVDDVETLDEQLAVLDAMPPLRGVVHAAGLLRDGLLVRTSLEDFEAVAAPKVVGTCALVEVLGRHPVDLVVHYGSAAAVLGSAGQAGYAAANAFLTAAAQHEATLCVDWGAWTEVGLAARDEARGVEHWRRQGLLPVRPEDALALLGALPVSARQVGLYGLDAARLADHPLRAELLALQTRAATTDGRTIIRPPTEPAAAVVALAEQLRAAAPDEARTLLVDRVRRELREVLGLTQAQEVEPHAGFAEMGMDSMMTMEFRRRLQDALATPLVQTVAFDFPTLDKLVAHLCDDVFALGDAANEAPPVPELAALPPVGLDTEDLDMLTDADLLLALENELS